jgi:FkbM family methyltransferase
MSIVERYLDGVRNMGLSHAIKLKVTKLVTSDGGLMSLTSKDLLHPVFCRMGTTDPIPFQQIFVQREYSCFDDLADAELILDLGANVGYASAYFLSRFPRAFVVAVEPDTANFAILEKNLAPYKGRYLAVNAAVWSEKTTLHFTATSTDKGNECGREVTADTQKAGTIAVDAIDIDSLVAMTPYNKISILKVDIEGAETQVFARGFETWLDQTKAFCIEIHAVPNAHETVMAAIAGRGFTLSTSGELTVGKR